MTMSAREKSAVVVAASATELEWTAEEEIQLFFALADIKPVGINKHFYMACITDRLCKSLNREVPAEAIWAHLRTMYNLDVLDELEPLPFPNEEREFSLPDTEFSALLTKKRAESEEKRLSSDSSTAGGPPSIIAVATDNTGKEKSTPLAKTAAKEMEKKIAAKLIEAPKRTPKRTRGSMSLESNSPSTTPPPVQSNKRRRI